MKRDTFYHCATCGNVVVKVYEGGGALSCCGEPMEVLEANSTDAATEKHVPVVERDGDAVKVAVGSVEHPMAEDHFIQWVYLVTEEGVLARCLKPGEAPVAVFDVAGQTPIAAYEYCNKHGLWKADI